MILMAIHTQSFEFVNPYLANLNHIMDVDIDYEIECNPNHIKYKLLQF